jgi:hypothetical protein
LGMCSCSELNWLFMLDIYISSKLLYEAMVE